MAHSCLLDSNLYIERQKLIEDLKILSIKKGEDFTLSSGQKSNIYIDVKQTMLYGPAMHNLAKLLYNLVDQHGWYDGVAGAPLGGLHLATMVAMYGAPTNVVLVRKEVKDHGTQKLVEAPLMMTNKVVLLEDVVTTGESVIKTAKILEESGYDIKGIVAEVDRRVAKSPILMGYKFQALVDFKELIEELDA